MKTLIVCALSILFLSPALSWSKASDFKSCQGLNCRDTKKYPSKDAQTQCLIAKRECHKRYLDMKLASLKKDGITPAQRKKILTALQRARSKSNATLSALKAKVKITEADLADIDKKIKQVESLPAKK